MVMTECSNALRRNVTMVELPCRCHAESEHSQLLAVPLLLLLPGEQDDVVVVATDEQEDDCPVGD